MRISDWSSDVCSSDLGNADVTIGNYDMWRLRGAVNIPVSEGLSTRFVAFREKRDGFTHNSVPGGTDANDADNYGFRGHILIEPTSNFSALLSGRSEEHTSELQSLMRLSFAVFCLKQKKYTHYI